MQKQRRRIAHLDMDAFYASVELLRYPELRGLPVVIGGSQASRPSVAADGTRLFSRLRHYVGRGVVTTATYEARALGVHSAMGLMKAARLAPEAILLPADFQEYRLYSRRFKAAIAQIAPKIEDRGIDEIYIDLTELGEPDIALARQLKKAVRDATSLTCSIGISPNKLLSKIASDLDKPDGITILDMSDIEKRVWPLAVGRINGIGPKAQARLKETGVTTIGELAHTSRDRLVSTFGERYAHWLLESAHGRDDRPVVTESFPKSVSRETTFERDLHVRLDRQVLATVLDGLCEWLEADLKRKRVVGRTVGVKVRYDDFRTVTRDHTLPQSISDANAIRRAAGLCLARVPWERRIRLLGLRVASLSRQGEEDDPSTQGNQAQLNLFS